MNSNPIVNQLFSSSSHDDKKKKKQPPKVVNTYENLLDPWKDLGRGFQDNIKNQSKASLGEAFKQVVGSDKLFHGSGDLKPGQELNLKAQKQQQEQQEKKQETKANIRPAMDYVGEILRSNEQATQQKAQEAKQEVQNLILELKSLANTNSLEKDVIEATTGQDVIKPGVYHQSFFKWAVSEARKRINDSNTWLNETKGKNAQKGGGKKKSSNNYWDMEKKHGTKFSLSGERSVSTQTG